MNRVELIEKARDEVSARENDCGCPIKGDLAESIGASVVDALLPQVTTVEELEALPDSTILVTDDGYVLQHFADQDAAVILRAFGTPLTVVWQP